MSGNTERCTVHITTNKGTAQLQNLFTSGQTSKVTGLSL